MENNAKTLKITEITKKQNVMSMITGRVVFDFVKSEIEKGEQILLSFSELKNCTTTFIGASIGLLYHHFGKEKLNEVFKIIEVEHPFWQELIDEHILLATDEEYRTKHRNALNDILESE